MIRMSLSVCTLSRARRYGPSEWSHRSASVTTTGVAVSSNATQGQR
jgi:hypothetical protein